MLDLVVRLGSPRRRGLLQCLRQVVWVSAVGLLVVLLPVVVVLALASSWVSRLLGLVLVVALVA